MIAGMELHVIFFLYFVNGIYGQVTPPQSTTVDRGDNVPLTCTSIETTPVFTWTYATTGQSLYIGSTRGTNAERYANIVLQEGTATQTSILNINDIQIEDDGEYVCSTVDETVTPPAAMVTVEVGSTPKDITLINIDNFANYQATCDAIGSKPQETITWMLDGVVQTEGIVETDPDISSDPLFDLRSVFTFPASLDNYNVTLVCMIGGHHSGSSLDRQESRRVDVQNPPYPGGIMIGLVSDGSILTVSCDPSDVVSAAIPPMDSFYIYSNGSLLTKESVSATSVEVTEPDYDTEYMCVGGNYLGNTTATEIFYPGRTTTSPTTTAPNTTEPVVGPSSTPGTATGLSTGEIAGIVVGAIIFIAIIIVLIVVFVVKPDCIGGSGSPNTTTTHKHSTSAVGSSNGNEKEKIRPEAAPRGHSSIKHTTDNPQQAEYAMVDRRPGGRGDSTDARGNGAGQNEQPGMHYADLDLTSSAGHSDRVVPKNEDGVVVYSSILV